MDPRRSAPIVGLVLLAAMTIGCGRSQSGVTVEATGAFLTASVERTVDTGTGRFELVTDSSGRSMGTSLKGSYDVKTRRAVGTMTLTNSARGTMVASTYTADIVVDNRIIYIKSSDPKFAEAHGKYVELDLDHLPITGDTKTIMSSMATLPPPLGGIASGMDPSGTLAFLRGLNATVREVGRMDVNGTTTTQLQTTITLGGVIDSAVPAGDRAAVKAIMSKQDAGLLTALLPVDVFVDADGLIRRISIDASPAVRSGRASTTGTTAPERYVSTVDYFDFGQPVDIALPAPAEVDNDPALVESLFK